MGIGFVYQDSQVSGALWSSLPYYSISLSLNVLLTLITIIRLILYARNTRTALGIIGIGGLCKAIIMMLVESCALFSANSLLIIGLLAAGNAVSGIFMATIGEIRVRVFLKSRSPGRLSDATTDRTGYRFAAPYSTSRQ